MTQYADADELLAMYTLWTGTSEEAYKAIDEMLDDIRQRGDA